MSENCQQAMPEGMEEENLLRHMSVAYMTAFIDECSLDDAYKAWSTMKEEDREEIRSKLRPLLPFVTKERARAESLEKQLAAEREKVGRLEELAEKVASFDVLTGADMSSTEKYLTYAEILTRLHYMAQDALCRSVERGGKAWEGRKK